MTIPGVFKFGLCAAVMALSAQSSTSQNARKLPLQAGVLRVQAPSVVVDVIVADKKGRTVEGLKKEDFTVYENNVPQKIVSFEPPALLRNERGSKSQSVGAQKAGSELRRAETPGSEVNFSGERRADSLAAVRFITIVMDSGDLQSPSLKAACDAASEYLRKDGVPEDYVAIYWIGQASLHLALPYSRDRDAATQAIAALARRTPAGIVTASERRETKEEMSELQEREYEERGSPFVLAYRSQRMALQSTLWNESSFQARSVFAGLRAIALSLATFPGRKNVVLFSEGFLHSPDEIASLAGVIDAANRSNVSFYVIDASGLTLGNAANNFSAEEANPGEHLTRGELQGPPTVDTLAAEMNELAQTGPEPTFGTDKFDWNAHLIHHDPDEDLERIAEGTGGLMIRNQNDLLMGLERADRDPREVYTLVYQPSNTQYDGALRRIRVAVRGTRYHIRYRKGYWAIPPGQGMQMTPAAAHLVSAADKGSLHVVFYPPLNAALLYSKERGWSLPVSLGIPGKAIPFIKKGDVFQTEVVMVVVARASNGVAVGEYDRVFDLRLDEAKFQQFREKTFDLTGQVSIAKEESIRVQVVLQLSNGDSAVASREVEWSDPEAKDLKATSVVLTNETNKGTNEERDSSDPLQVSGYKLTLPSEPRFATTDTLTVYVGVLHAGINPITNEPDLRFSPAIKSGDKTVANLPDETVEISQGDSGQLQFLRQYALKDLNPGQYTLEVAIEDLVREERLTRSSEFEIR